MATAKRAILHKDCAQEYPALTGRFVTAKRKQRRIRNALDKQLRALYNELLEVRNAQRNAVFVDRKPPVQRGWKRFFILRPDLEKIKDAAFFLELLEKINTITYSHRKDFKMKKRRNRKRMYVEKEQRLHEPRPWELSRLQLTEKEMNYFKLVKVPIGNSTKTYDKYVFTEPWRFVLRIRPNMITQVRVIDPALISREKQIDNFLERRNLVPRMSKIIHGHSWSFETNQRRRAHEAFLRKMVNEQLNELQEQHE